MTMEEQDQARGQSRLKEFKNVNKGKDEWRQRRNTSNSELRQNKRESQISKRRQGFRAMDPSINTSGVNDDGQTPNVGDVANLQKYVEQANSNDPTEVQDGVQSIRVLMCVKKDPPIKPVVNSGVHVKLVQLLGSTAYPKLQFEAAWALTNIVSGDKEDTASVVQANAIPSLAQLLDSPVDKVRAQVAWALGNIAGENVQYRDMVLREGTMQKLLGLLWAALNSVDNTQGTTNQTQEHEMLTTGTWAISNFVRGDKTTPGYYEMIEGCIDFLARILSYSGDVDTLADACWALSYLTESDNNRIQKVVESHVTKRLIDLMGMGNKKVVSPALRTIGNIVTGTDVQTSLVIRCGGLPALDKLLDHQTDSIRKESAWAMSNIFAGTPPQIKKALEETELPDGTKVAKYEFVSKLLNMMKTDKNSKARKEAAWAITNLITIGKEQDMRSVVYDYDGLDSIMTFLRNDILVTGQLRKEGNKKAADSLEQLAYNILTALHKTVLPAGSKMGYAYNIYSQRIKEIDNATDTLEKIALFPSAPNNKNLSLAQLAQELLDMYFKDESAEAAEYTNSNVNHGVNASGQMEFNPNLQGGQFEL